VLKRAAYTCAFAAGCVVAVSAWAGLPAHQGPPPAGEWTPRSAESWHITGPDAEARRLEALRRAAVRIGPSDRVSLGARGSSDRVAPISCRYVAEAPSGTSPKFHCVAAGGEILKVKYGRNPEVQAEAAAAQLTAALGFASDAVAIVPTLRCYGCPRFPFASTRAASLFPSRLFTAWLPAGGYTDFEWVSVERKFPAVTIETERTSGWAWWELKWSRAPRADVDALRLLAAFLAHWDNKSDNQRLVCLDAQRDASNACAHPLLMLDDLGATFGPYKVNLVNWRDAPIWADARTCEVTMRPLPYGGATFPNVRISEEGRSQFARQLAMLTASDIRALFADARFPQFYSGTDDARDLDAWTRAFLARADRIRTAGPCA
jgi:hypothetical protein